MVKYSKYLLVLCLTALLAVVSCEQSSINSPSTDHLVTNEQFDQKVMSNDQLRSLSPLGSFDEINSILANQGLNVRLAFAETVTLGEGGAETVGQTIYANDREKQLTAQWVPGDVRRDADGNNLTYIIFDPFAPANFGTADQIDSTPAIDASFETWNSVKNRSKLNIVKRPNTNSNPSFILGGNPFLADISEIGFLPGIFFELFIGPGTSVNVLGVTITFIFVDDDGNPTDINNDGFDDVALKEVWYNDDFQWTTNSGEVSNTVIDIETVALHENGHALGFGHFGKISVTNNNNKLHVSPRAVMNAIVLGTQRDLLGTDKASYRSIYGNWPK